jgi:hypothetical protein
MDNYEPGIYTERVLEAVKVLRDQGKHAHILGCVDPEDGSSKTPLKVGKCLPTGNGDITQKT